MSQQTAIIFTLPSELHLAIVGALDLRSIVTFRQTCKCFYNLEKTYHDDIWRQHNLYLCRITSLFPPTFQSHLEQAKFDQESTSQRAILTEAVLLESQEGGVQTPMSKHHIDLEGGPPLTSSVHSVFLVSGGRYLLLMNETLLQVWDLSPYRDADGAPILLSSFSVPTCCGAYASTIAGPQSTSVRLLVRSLYQYPTPELKKKYGISGSEVLDIYTSFELSFTESVPALKSLFELPLARQGGLGASITISQTTAMIMLEELYVIGWNFLENTYAYWRHYSHGGPVTHQPYLSDGHINLVFHEKNAYVTMPIPPLVPAYFPNNVFRLPIYAPAAGISSLNPGESKPQFVGSNLPNENRKHRSYGYRELKRLQPTTHWGIKSGEVSTAVIRDHHSDRIDTTWYHCDPLGFLDLPEATMMGKTSHAMPDGYPIRQDTFFLPGGDEDFLTPDIERCGKSYSDKLVTMSMWTRGYLPVEHTVFASISSTPNPGEVYDPSQIEETTRPRGQLFPLPSVGTPVVGFDFCPLSGIFVSVSGYAGHSLEGSRYQRNHLVRIHDLVKHRLSKVQS